MSSLEHEAYVGTAVERGPRELAVARDSGNRRTETTQYWYGIQIEPFGNGEFVYHFAEEGKFVIGSYEPGHYAAGHRVTIQVRASSERAFALFVIWSLL